MSKKLFVGNLPFEVNDADLTTVLGVVGKVVEAKVIINKKTGRSKGYGFVEMETEALAQDAVKKFEGATLNERSLTVQLATPKQEADAKTEAKTDAKTEAKVESADAAPSVSAEATPAASVAPSTDTASTETQNAEQA